MALEGSGGSSLPAGGTTGQVLAKTSGVDFETGWADVSVAYDDLSDTPTEFPPSAHDHVASEITDFAAAVAATAAVVANTAKVSNATHTGEVTGATALTIASGAVTNAKMADMATARIKGRSTAGTGSPEDLTGTQATALLDAFTSAAKGLAPASGGGTTNFLRADGSWAAPVVPTDWAIRILDATQAMANDTTVQPWFSTAGGLALDADSTYEFEGSFFSLNGATSHGLNMQFANIAGAVIQWNSSGAKVTATAQATALRRTATNTFATNRNVTTASTVAGSAVRVWGTVRTTGAGTLTPNVAQTAASGSFTVQPGTFFRARKIGAASLTNTGEWA